MCCRVYQNLLHVSVLQGNQMTLVFLEREYSSPEEPHLGIVHIVEVKSLMEAKQSKRVVSDVKLTARQSKGQMVQTMNQHLTCHCSSNLSLDLRKGSVVSCAVMRSCSAFKDVSSCASGPSRNTGITWLDSLFSDGP